MKAQLLTSLKLSICTEHLVLPVAKPGPGFVHRGQAEYVQVPFHSLPSENKAYLCEPEIPQYIVCGGEFFYLEVILTL